MIAENRDGTPFVRSGTMWLSNIAMENGPFINGVPINSMVIFHGYVSHNQMVFLVFRNLVDKSVRSLPSGRSRQGG